MLTTFYEHLSFNTGDLNNVVIYLDLFKFIRVCFGGIGSTNLK